MCKCYLKSIVAWLVGIYIAHVYSLVLAGYLANALVGKESRFATFFAILCSIFVAIIAGAIAVKVMCRKKGLDSKGYIRLGVIVLSLLPVAFWMMDDAPIENDWRQEELIPQGKDVTDSYESLQLFMGDRKGKLSFTGKTGKWNDEFFNKIVDHQEEIEKVWQENEELRKKFEVLDEYAVIADLKAGVTFEIDSPIIRFSELRNLAILYQARAYLDYVSGKKVEAINTLNKINRIVRKALPHATVIIHKACWNALAIKNLETAARIAKHPNCSTVDINMLRQSFKPFSPEDVSLEKCFKNEYLVMKRLSARVAAGDLGDMSNSGIWGAIASVYQQTGSNLIYKHNRSCRTMKKFYQLFIEEAGKAPFDCPNSSAYMTDYSSKLDPLNLGGWIFIAIATPGLQQMSQSMQKPVIMAEMLEIYMGKVSNQKKSLNDPYTGKPYKSSEKGQLHSAGPDGKYFTDDDVRL